MGDPLLELRDVRAGYGEAVVLDGVSIALPENGSLAVLGRNGVGKTTLLLAAMGFVRLMRGSIMVAGRDASRLSPHKRAQMGLGWVPQEREIFPSLSVEENLQVAARPGRWDLGAIWQLFPRLKERRANMGNQLSGGEQQMLAIARTLTTNPSVLLLDEPLEGLAPIIVEELTAAVRTDDRGRGHRARAGRAARRDRACVDRGRGGHRARPDRAPRPLVRTAERPRHARPLSRPARLDGTCPSGLIFSPKWPLRGAAFRPIRDTASARGDPQGMENFDFVVVGAGTAGCLLADRLTQSGRFRVLLLEAGGTDRRFMVRMPIGYGHSFYNPRVNWMYETVPQEALAGRSLYCPRGKLLGGSSSINAMIFARGQRRDFDEWRDAGNPGWGYDDVLPYFKSFEDFTGPASPERGRGGPLRVIEMAGQTHPLCETFLEAAEQAGLSPHAGLQRRRRRGCRDLPDHHQGRHARVGRHGVSQAGDAPSQSHRRHQRARHAHRLRGAAGCRRGLYRERPQDVRRGPDAR